MEKCAPAATGKEKAYIASIGELCWPPRKLSRSVEYTKDPIHPRAPYLPLNSPISFGKEKLCTGARWCMFSLPIPGMNISFPPAFLPSHAPSNKHDFVFLVVSPCESQKNRYVSNRKVQNRKFCCRSRRENRRKIRSVFLGGAEKNSQHFRVFKLAAFSGR